MAQLFAAAPANSLPEVPNSNVCPTDPVHVVTSTDGARQLSAMRWGFVPHWYKEMNGGPLLFNARSETIAQKPVFRDACRARRCLIPASWFYEWTTGDAGRKQPWKIGARDASPLALAGIWQDWGPPEARVATCAIVTVAANSVMARLHHRMPVMVALEHWPLWLGEAGHGAARLMRAAPEDALEFDMVAPF